MPVWCSRPARAQPRLACTATEDPARVGWRRNWNGAAGTDGGRQQQCTCTRQPTGMKAGLSSTQFDTIATRRLPYPYLVFGCTTQVL